MTDIRRDGIMECRKKTYTKKGATEKRKFETTEKPEGRYDGYTEGRSVAA